MRPPDPAAHPAPRARADAHPGRGVPVIAVLLQRGIGVRGELRDDGGVLPVRDRGGTPRRGAGGEGTGGAPLLEVALDAGQADGEAGGDPRLAQPLLAHRPHDADTQVVTVRLCHAISIARAQPLCNPL